MSEWAETRAALVADHPLWSHQNVHHECGMYPCLVQLALTRIDELEGALREWAEEAERSIAWRTSRGMKPASDTSLFGSTSLSATQRIGREARRLRGETP